MKHVKNKFKSSALLLGVILMFGGNTMIIHQQWEIYSPIKRPFPVKLFFFKFGTLFT